MSFSTMRHWLAGGAMIVAVAGAAQAQEDPSAALNARYAEFTAALLGKDSAKLGTILAPEYQATDIRGETRNRADLLARVGQMQVPPEMKPQTKVLSVKLDGTTAAVESQTLLQIQRPDENGKDVKLDIAITAQDTWVQRDGVWLFQKSVQQEMAISKDGEVVFRQAK